MKIGIGSKDSHGSGAVEAFEGRSKAVTVLAVALATFDQVLVY